MGREIDERVVQMKFENGQFEKGISTSIRSMEELKKGMDFDDAVKGFEKLDVAAKSFKLDGLASGIETVRVKFDLLQIAAFRVLDRIATRAIDTGERMVKGLTIDQVAVGWDKFASKTTSVQTIMAATAKQFTDTGKQMEVVNGQLDKLNWFTDETSYNFVDMVNNIGKFTSNNIDLETSVTAMQGIANWAAISGANANEASRAMYNMSQAMAAGAMKLQDWISIENANMGTAAFKEMAIQAALTAGTLVKQGDKIMTVDKKMEVSVEKFRETLSKGWLTKDIMLNTLDQYGGATNRLNELYEETGLLTSEIVGDIDNYISGAKTAEDISKDWNMSLEQTQKVLDEFNTETMQFGLKAFKAAQEAKTFEDAINSVKDAVSTGWMKSFEYIFGDYLEAKEFFTDLANVLYDIFAASGEARNESLKYWKMSGGRQLLIDSIWASLSAIMAILKPIGFAWNDVFGELSWHRLRAMTKSLHDFTLSIANLAKDNMPKVQAAFRGLFSVLDIALNLFGAIGRAIAKVIGYFHPFSNGILTGAASLGDFLYNLDQAIKKSKIFDKFFGTIADAVIIVVGAVTKLVSAFMEFTGLGQSISNASYSMISPLTLLGNAFDNIKKRLESFSKSGSSVMNKIITDFKNGSLDLSSITEIIKNAFSSLSSPFSSFDLGGALDIINSGAFALFVKKLYDFSKGLGKLDIWKPLSKFQKALEPLGDALNSFSAKMNSETLKTMSTSILILAGALLILSSINPDRLAGALAAITVLFGELSVAMKQFMKLFSGKINLQVAKLSSLMITMSIGLLILTASVKKLGSLDYEQLAKGLSGVIALLLSLSGAMKLLSSGSKDSKSLKVSAVSVIALASAILILSKAVEKFAAFDIVSLAKGLSSVGILLLELSVFAKQLDKVKFGVSTSLGVMAVATAMLILSTAMQKIAAIPISGVAVAIASISALLFGLQKFEKALSSQKGLFSAGVSINLVAIAISSLTKSLISMASVPIESLVVSLLAMANALGIVVYAVNRFPKNMISSGAGLIIVAGAISILMKTLRESGDAGSLAKSLIALAGAMIIISLGLKSIAKSGIQGSASMLVLSSALLVLAPALKKLSDVGAFNLAKTLVVLSGGLLALGFVAKTLKPLGPALISLSGSIGVFSLSVLALGVGVSLLSAGLTGLGAAAAVGVGGLSVALTEFIHLIPVIIKEIGVGIIAFATVIEKGAPAIADAFVALILSGLHAISETVPEIVDTLLEIFEKVIATLLDRIPRLSKSLGEMFSGFTSEGFKDFSIALSIVIATLVSSMRLLEKAKGLTKNGILTLGIMVAATGLIGYMISNLSKIANPQSIIPLATAIGECILALSVAFKIASTASNDINSKNLLAFGVIAVIATALSGALAAFSTITNPQTVIPLATAIGIAMMAIGASMRIISGIQGDVSAVNVGMFGIISVIAGLMGNVISELSNIANPQGVLPIAAGISLVMISLAAVVKLLNTIPPAFLTGAWSAIGMMGTIVAAMSVLTIAIGELMQLPGFKKVLSDGGEGMLLLGRAIGGFIGGILGGFAEGALSFIPQLGTYLSDFMENAKPFFDGIQGIPSNLGDTISSLSVALLALTGAELLNSLGNFASSIFGSKDQDLSSKFEMFGNALSAFSRSLGKGFNADKVLAAAQAGEALANLENSLPAQGGKLQQWLGSKTLDSFGDRLGVFGTAIASFSETVSNLKVEAVQGAASAGESLANLENSLPAQGGKLQQWLGSKTLDSFGSRMVLFGRSLASFADTVKGITADKVEGAVNAGKLVADLEENVPPQNGMLQAFLGSNNISDFGSRMQSFGEGLKNFSNEVVGLDHASMLAAINTTKKLVEMEGDIDTTGGWGELFTGKSDFSSLGDNLSGLGRGLNALSNSLSAVDLDEIDKAIRSVRSVINLTTIPNANYATIVTIGANLKQIGPGIKELGAGADDFDSVKMDQTTGAIRRLLELADLKSAPEWLKACVDHAGKMVTQFKLAVDKEHENIRKAGKFIAEWFVKGLSQGLDEYLPLATNSATKMAERVDEAVCKALGIASPSVVMIEEGHWIVRGLAEGIKADTSAEEAAEKKASNIVSAFQTALDKIDLLQTNRQKKFDLWSITEGLGASDAEYQQRALELKEAELKDAAEQVKVQQAAFATAQKLFEEGSKQWIEAENRVLDAKKAMYEIRNEIEQSQAQLTLVEANSFSRNAKAYESYIKEWETAYEMMGYSKEDLYKKAAEVTGFGKEDTGTGRIDTQAIIDAALSEQQVEIVQQQTKQKVKGAVSSGIVQGTNAGVGQAVEELSGNSGSALTALASNLKGGSSGKEILDAVIGSENEWVAGGKNTVRGYVKGVNEEKSNANKVTRDAAQENIEAYAEGLGTESPSKFTHEMGINVNQGLINGLNETRDRVSQTTNQIGLDAMEGFRRGIHEKGQAAIAEATAIANEVAAQMARALQINSPSKLTRSYGNYLNEGLVLGMRDGLGNIENATYDVAGAAKDALTNSMALIDNIIESDDSFSPKITPVINLDELKRQGPAVQRALGRTRLNVDTGRIQSNLAARNGQSSQNGSNQNQNETNYNFVQNNYSPKALNRAEIYRQTRNQFSQLKGASQR